MGSSEHMSQFSVTILALGLCAVTALPTFVNMKAESTRDALFFCEQRAGRVGYIGWPPIGCTTDADCKGINGSYCVNDPTKKAPYVCHEPEVFVTKGLDKPVGIAVDSATQQIFYNQDDQASGDTYWPLSQISVDGTKKSTVINKLLDPQGLAVDTEAKEVYYVEHHGQRVGKVDYDGKNQKVLHQFGGNDYPSDVKVDAKNNKIFALVEGLLSTGHKLVSMDLEGKNVTVLKSDIVRSYGLTLDTANKVVYYINGGHGGFIGNVSYDGQDAGTVLDGLDWPYMLDYDPVRELLVFSTTGVGDGVISTCKTNGENVQKTVELSFAPMGVVFGKVPIN